MVSWFQGLQERWGRLTLAQIRRVSRLLADHADLIYRLADRVERGAARPRLPKRLGVRQLAARVARAGREDDPVTWRVLAKRAELAEASERTPRTTPRALRDLGIALANLAEDVEDARAIPHRQPPPSPRGRRPNFPLAQLLAQGTKLGVADVEIARALARPGARWRRAGRPRLRRARPRGALGLGHQVGAGAGAETTLTPTIEKVRLCRGARLDPRIHGRCRGASLLKS